MSNGTILFIFTSADKTLDGKPVGWYTPEGAHPYFALKDHFKLDAASPKGGTPPVDLSSVEKFTDDESKAFLNDDDPRKFWENTKKIADVKAENYIAIFVVGGHGPMIDLAFDKQFAKLVEDFYAAKKPVAAVCHGPGGLVLAKTPEGKSILSGIEATGFSNAEEAQTPYNDFVNTLPFSLEDRIKELGGKYTKAGDWESKVVWDGGVLTGQNPASAGPLGRKLREILSK